MCENNSSTAQLILNTTQSSCKGFNEYVSACEEFERLNYSNRPRLSYGGSIKAKMAKEETFDSSKINEDRYTTASDYQNTYNASAVTTTTNLSQSIGDAFQYFDEDIMISSPSSRSTPTNFKNVGKVAALVANFKQQTEFQKQPNSKSDSIKPNIKQLRALYDETANQNMKNSQKSPPAMKSRIIKPTALKAPALIQAVKIKSSTIKPQAPVPASPQISRKMKVKQMAQMFNAKISQLMQRNPAEVAHYTPLNNEYSPDPKQQLNRPKSTPPVAMPRKQIAVANSAPKRTPPLPKQRNKLPTYRTGGGVRSPQPSPRLRRRNSLRTADKTFFVVEDAFSQLSVKDKVLLYTKFINDMSQKNTQLSKNSESFECNLKKQLASGEVVNEKQESVKHLTEELEAKCNFPKLTISPKALLRMQSIIDTTFVGKQTHDAQTSTCNKDDDQLYRAECAQIVEDSEVENPLHVSTLTVMLKASPKPCSLPSSAERPRVLSNNQRLLHHLSLMEPSHKRSNESIRSVHLNRDPYAPPKKIRRTRSEQLNPVHFFQNSNVKKQFFEWVKERNGLDFAIKLSVDEQKFPPTDEVENSATANISEVTQKSAVDRLLEEAMVKLTNSYISTYETEAVEINDNIVLENRVTVNNVPPTTPLLNKARRKQKRPAPLPPTGTQTHTNCDSGISTLRKEAAVQTITTSAGNSTASSTLSSIKQSDNERESGISYLPKSTTDESQPIEHKNTEFEFERPQKPPRRKKMRRPLSYKSTSETNLVEITKTATTSTADSDSDKLSEKHPSSPSTAMKSKQQNNIKKLYLKTLKAMPLLRKSITPKKSKSIGGNESPILSKELNKKILRALNSPRRIKLAYNLTFLTSTSPNTSSDKGENNQQEISTPPPNLDRSHSLPLNREQTPDNDITLSTAHSPTNITNMDFPPLQRPLSESFIDQGFETATNSVESPIRLKRQNCVILNDQASLPFQESFTLQRCDLNKLHALHQSQSNQDENPANFSTPVKGNNQQQSFISPAVMQQQNFSPILTPLKSRRSESQRGSIAMQVIPEDHVYDAKNMPTFTLDTLNSCENAFFANAPTLDMSSNAIDFDMEKHSFFWIMVDEYSVAIKINYYSVETIRLFYHNFSQKYTNRLDLHFGVDNSKFSFYNPHGSPLYKSQREPSPKPSSHYWFSTADLAIPFNGNFMPTKRVLRLFKFLRDCIDDDSVIHCGVDNIEFTCPPDRYSSNTTKFSLESNYSMLIGLQSGKSNGLEGRSHFAWPNPLCNILNANNVQISDLDQPDFDSFSLGSSDLRQNSNSPFSATSTMSFSENTTRPSSSPGFNDAQTNQTIEEEALQQIYKDAQVYNLRKSEVDKLPRRQSLTASQLMETLTSQLEKLKLFEERFNAYVEENSTSAASFQNCQELPEHIRKLRNVIRIIENIGDDNGFRTCHPLQLESLLSFLNRYAELTLTKFTADFDKILGELHQQQPVQN